MGDTQMAELRALEAAATPGPWRVCRETDVFGGLGMPVCRMDGDDALTVGNPMDWGPTAPTDADAAFIAAARNALPALLARVERLEAVAEAARALLPAVTVYGGGPGRATIPICDVCMTERGHDAGCTAAALAAALAAVEPAG